MTGAPETQRSVACAMQYTSERYRRFVQLLQFAITS